MENRAGAESSPDDLVQVPRWAFNAIGILVRSRVHEEQHIARTGRVAKWGRGYKERYKHFFRWFIVSALLQRGSKYTDDAVFGEASERLAGSVYAGGPGAIKSSYEQMQREFREDPVLEDSLARLQ